MKKKIKQIKLLCASSLLLISSITNASTEAQSNLTVASVIPGGGGVYIGFSTRPSDCGGNYKSAHAFLSNSTKNFEQLFALVAQAELIGSKVTIQYTDAGNCTSADTLLKILNIQ